MERLKGLLLLGIVLTLPALHAQDAGPEEQIGTPRNAAEPTRTLTKHPLDLFNAILLVTPAERERSLRALVGERLEMYDFATVPESQIRAVQLDDDSESEFIVIIHARFLISHVVLADESPQSWNVVGQFDYTWHWNSEDAERIVELHSPFILIRDQTGGSCMYQTPVSVYRLWKGKLYKTLDILEADYHCVLQTPSAVTTNRRIRFRQERFSPWMALEVRTEQKTTQFDDNRGEKRERVDAQSCEGYEWMPGSFRFVLTEGATRALCQ